MFIKALTQRFARILFFAALAVLGVAIVEIVVNAFGYTVLRDVYSAGRLIELSAAVLVFVIAVLLRQMRDELKNSKSD